MDDMGRIYSHGQQDLVCGPTPSGEAVGPHPSMNVVLPASLASKSYRDSQARQELLGDPRNMVIHSQPLEGKPQNLWLQLKGEMLGTFVLIFGIVAGTATQMRKEADEEFFDVDIHSKGMFGTLGGSIGVAVAFMVSFDVSGAHINPAVTLSFMLFDGFPVRKGLLYMVAQFIGSFLAALLCCVLFTGGTGEEKYLVNFYHTSVSPGTDMFTAFLAEIVCTGMLLCGIKFLGSGGPPEVNKLILGFGISTIVFFILTNFGYLSGGSLNPCREFPPRLVRFMDATLRGNGAGILDNWDWFCPTVAPMIGGPLGCALYKLCSDSDAPASKKAEELELS